MKKNSKTRLATDFVLNFLTFLSSLFSILVLITIFLFIFINGFHLLSFKLIFGDYTPKVEVLDLEYGGECKSTRNMKSDEYYSKNWGIALTDAKNTEGKNVVYISYISPDSPLRKAVKANEKEFFLREGLSIEKAIAENNIALSRYGAKKFFNTIEESKELRSVTLKEEGGGIRGSIITTIYLVILTLIISLPFGICSAIYLNEYSKNGTFKNIIQSMIETLTGVPSVLFGLLGAALFIPLVNNITRSGNKGGSILSGALTMAFIIVPTIINTTQESLKNVDNSLRYASLSLGASKMQTVFKIVIPSAFSGIITATILSIGRIVGESAALIFAVGTVIKDKIFLGERSTSLAVHIWTLMSGEVPNFHMVSSISIIIFLVVLVLNVSFKIVTKKLNHKTSRS